MENAKLYDDLLDLIKNPDELKLKEYLKDYDGLSGMLHNYIPLDNGGDVFQSVIAHCLYNKPKENSELDKLITEALKDKRILEIGAGRKPILFRNYTKDYIVAERKRDIFEKFYQENEIKSVLYEGDYNQFHKKLDEAGPFDIICSRRVFFDGDCDSIDTSYSNNPLFDDSGKIFADYHKHLKNGGIACHSGNISKDMITGANLKAVSIIKELENIWGHDYYSEYVYNHQGYKQIIHEVMTKI